MNYAVIDLGSNTIRLSIFRLEGETIKTVFRQKELAALASYITNSHLALEGIDRACDTLLELKKSALNFVKEDEIHVFATAALREVENQEHVLEKIHSKTGLNPVILSGEEEAHLGFLGESYYSKYTDGILIDIGGGSTELVQFKDSKPVKVASLPMGCLNIYSKYVDLVVPTEKESAKIRDEIIAQFDTTKWGMPKQEPIMIGVGGTLRAFRSLASDMYSFPEDETEIPAVYVSKILHKIKHNEDEIFLKIYKTVPERTLTITTGLLIANEIINIFGCETILVSNYGVREGYLLDRVLK